MAGFWEGFFAACHRLFKLQGPQIKYEPQKTQMRFSLTGHNERAHHGTLCVVWIPTYLPVVSREAGVTIPIEFLYNLFPQSETLVPMLYVPLFPKKSTFKFGKPLPAEKAFCTTGAGGDDEALSSSPFRV